MDRNRIAAALALLTIAVACSAATLSGKPPPGDLLFSSQNIPRFQIQIAPKEFETLRRDNRTYVHATVTVGTNRFQNVGVRLKGHGSFRPLDDKPSLAVKFDEFAPSQKLYGLNKVLLNNANQDTSLLSEYIAAVMFHDSGVPAARVGHARVDLNSRDLGLYVLAEAMNKTFFKQHFKDSSGNLYDVNAQDIDQRLTQSSGVTGDQSDVAVLVTAARLPSDQRAKALAEVLDVDRFLSFLAISMLGAQHDSYPLNRNNYRLYHDPVTKRFVMMPHGIDGSFSRLATRLTPPPKYVLTKAIVETPSLKESYDERVAILFTNAFNLDKLTNRIYAAARRLQGAASNEMERASIDARARGFARRVTQRHQSVMDQLAGIDVVLLQLNSGAALRLTNWLSEVNRGSATFGRDETEGRHTLTIHTAPGDSLASWRQRLLLAPGSYRFRAEVRLASPGGDTVGAMNGIGVRTSGRPAPLKAPTNATWAAMEFQFVVREGEEDVQFVCECRGSNLLAWFDLDSLVLRRE